MRKHACRARRREGWRGEEGRRVKWVGGGGDKPRGASQTRGLASEASARLDAEGKKLQLQVVNEEQANHEHGEAGLHGEVDAKGERVEHTGNKRLHKTQKRWAGGAVKTPPVAYDVLAMHLLMCSFVPERGSRSR